MTRLEARLAIIADAAQNMGAESARRFGARTVLAHFNARAGVARTAEPLSGFFRIID